MGVSEPKRKRHHSENSGVGEAGTVIFNVSGRRFEVLRQTIEAHPATFLASLLEDAGSDGERPVFVDASSERFAHILDWYRHGEMHVAEGCPLGGLVRDARFFQLPDMVRINGSLHSTCPEPADAAREAGPAHVTYEAAVADVKRHWPSFEHYVASIIAEVRMGAASLGEKAALGQAEVDRGSWSTEDISRSALAVRHFHLASPSDWADEDNVCSLVRLNVLLRELARRGYHCEVDLEGGVGLELKVGLRSASALEARRRVQLAGVDVSAGKLQVCSHRPDQG